MRVLIKDKCQTTLRESTNITYKKDLGCLAVYAGKGYWAIDMSEGESLQIFDEMLKTGYADLSIFRAYYQYKKE